MKRNGSYNTNRMDYGISDESDLYKNSDTVKRIYIAVGVLFAVCVFISKGVLTSSKKSKMAY